MSGRLLGSVVLLVALGACGDLPRDVRGTLEEVRGDTLRVGYIVDPPWVVAGEDAPEGVEPRLVRAYARELDAGIVWVAGTESELMRLLRGYELDLVIGGLVRSTPYGREVALTLPFDGWDRDRKERQHVWAVAKGENAWLVRTERFLHRSRRAPALAQEGLP